MNNTILMLEVIEHPEEYKGAGVLEITDTGANLGRSNRCLIQLPDMNKYVSGTHCLITCYGGEYFVNDVSTNGTYVNGNKLEKNQPTTILQDDVLLIGRYKLTAKFESKFNGFRIDQDITPDINITDPLELIQHHVPERNLALEEPLKTLIEEISGEEQVDSDDPLDLLHEHIEQDDLIGKEVVQPEPDPFRSQMQLPDDSNDLLAEMPMPIIPDNWLEDVALDSATDRNVQAQGTISTADPVSLSTDHAVNNKPVREESPRQVEDINLTADIPGLVDDINLSADLHSAIPISDIPAASPQPVQLPEPPVTVPVVHNLGQPEAIQHLMRGLGVDLNLEGYKADWFESLGRSLRVCLEDLVKQLNASAEFESSTQPNLTSAEAMLDLMQALHQEHEVMPDEFFSELADDAARYRDLKTRAFHRSVQTVVNQLHPENFTQPTKLSLSGKSAPRSWYAYQEFYRQNYEQSEAELALTINKNLAQDFIKLRNE
ncbi:FHA domain-containing protein [Vibrio sp. WXL103]|uniref:FHA domain-containing protein n=1 Tax=unclassified Vibrio TaxID=2614977 RepID=UPI003EC5D333